MALGNGDYYESTFTQDSSDPKVVTYDSTDLLSKAIDIVQIEVMKQCWMYSVIAVSISVDVGDNVVMFELAL